MTLTNLHLGGFRCFRDPIDVPLRPVTLLFGENSSGKTTLLQAIDLALMHLQVTLGKGVRTDVSVDRRWCIASERGGGLQIDLNSADLDLLLGRCGLSRRVTIPHGPAAAMALGLGFRCAPALSLDWRFRWRDCDSNGGLELPALELHAKIQHEERQRQSPDELKSMVWIQADSRLRNAVQDHLREGSVWLERPRDENEEWSDVHHELSGLVSQFDWCYRPRGDTWDGPNSIGASIAARMDQRLSHLLSESSGWGKESVESNKATLHDQQGRMAACGPYAHIASENSGPPFSWLVTYTNILNEAHWSQSVQVHDRLREYMGAIIGLEVAKRYEQFPTLARGTRQLIQGTEAFGDAGFYGYSIKRPVDMLDHAEAIAWPSVGDGFSGGWDAEQVASGGLGYLIGCRPQRLAEVVPHMPQLKNTDPGDFAAEKLDLADREHLFWRTGERGFPEVAGPKTWDVIFTRAIVAIAELAVIAELVQVWSAAAAASMFGFSRNDVNPGVANVLESVSKLWSPIGKHSPNLVYGDPQEAWSAAQSAAESGLLESLSKEMMEFLDLLDLSIADIGEILQIQYRGDTSIYQGKVADEEVLPGSDNLLVGFRREALDRLHEGCRQKSSPSTRVVDSFLMEEVVSSRSVRMFFDESAMASLVFDSSVMPNRDRLLHSLDIAKSWLRACADGTPVSERAMLMYAWLYQPNAELIDPMLDLASLIEETGKVAASITPHMSGNRGQLGRMPVEIHSNANSVFSDQLQMLQTLCSSEDQERSGQDCTLLANVNYWLRRLGVDYDVALRRCDIGSTQGVALELFDACDESVDRNAISIADVGYGVSQVLPIVVECLAEGCTKLIDEPEASVHPKLQASIGSLFLEVAQSGRQVIAATHSEHLVLRMMRLVRLGKIAADDVSIIYVSRDEIGSHAKRLRLDERGDFIDEWPGGFFDDRLNELVGGEEGL